MRSLTLPEETCSVSLAAKRICLNKSNVLVGDDFASVLHEIICVKMYAEVHEGGCSQVRYRS